MEGYRRACAIAAQCPQTQIVRLPDSEGDIYECFAEAATINGTKAEWIVQACQDRALADETAGKRYETVAARQTLGTLTIQVSACPAQSHDGSKRRQARSARTTTVTVRACRVTLQAPWRRGQQLPDLEVNAVLVRETDPPTDEAVIEWLLLTSLAAETFAQACTVIHHYICCWGNEQLFKDIKEVWRAGQQQVRNVYASIGAFTINLVLYSMVEVWAWARDAQELVDRSRSQWDTEERRPSHADKRKAVPGEILRGEIRAVVGGGPSEKSFRNSLCVCSIWPHECKAFTESTGNLNGQRDWHPRWTDGHSLRSHWCSHAHLV